MTLPSFDEKNVEPKVEWDGKDFRGNKCWPKDIRFMRAHPKVLEWLKDRPKGSIHNSCTTLEALSKFLGLTPQQFLELDKKAARDEAWRYISSFKMQHPAKAIIHKAWIQSFYYWHNEEKLAFIPHKHDIVYEPNRIKKRMSKDVCWKIIHKTKNLRDETILLFDFESGLRRNAIAHLNFGHYKNFIWFKKTEGGDVVKSNEREGNIAIFKVMATPTIQFTHDNKLRGKGINWYYGCLHKEATAILKEYVAQYHQDSKDNTPLWYPLCPVNKNKRLDHNRIYGMFKSCIKRSSLPTSQINFHAFRRGFRSVVRNTSGITDNEFKEAIMGHKLRGAEEAYFDKDPLEFAREYAKCDFSEPNVEKDKALAEKEREVERLREQLKTVTDAQTKTKKKLTIPSGPLGGPAPTIDSEKKRRLEAALKEASYEEPKHDFQQAKPQPPKSELLRHTKPMQKTHVSMKPIEQARQDDWVVCPDRKDSVRKSVECKKCGEENFKKFSECYKERVKHPFSDLFKCSKPKRTNTSGKSEHKSSTRKK